MTIERWIAVATDEDVRRLLTEANSIRWIPTDEEADVFRKVRPELAALDQLAIDLDLAAGAGRLCDRIDDMLHEYDAEQAERDAIDDDERWPDRPCGIGGLDR